MDMLKEVRKGKLDVTNPYGPFAWDGIKTIHGNLPRFEVGEWAKVKTVPDEKDPLGIVPETGHMIGESFEVLIIKIMAHPKRGLTFIYGLHYAFHNKLQYFWEWNLERDVGR